MSMTFTQQFVRGHFHSCLRPRLWPFDKGGSLTTSAPCSLHSGNWCGGRMTGFEIWMHIVSVLIFSVLGILKYENIIDQSWWIIFIPLFTCDGLCAYFCIIVFIRQYQELDLRVAGIRFLTSILSTMLFFVFKFLMCEKFSEKRMLSSSEVIAPLFILLQIIMIRACRLH